MAPNLNGSYTASSPCPCCGATEAQIVATVDGKTGEPLTTLSCAGCGLGRIDPLPTAAELEAWYANHYRQAYKGCESPKMKYVLRAARNARDRYLWLQENSTLPLDQGHLTTLDIGASSGEFVYLMAHKKHQAHGIEPHQGYAEYAQSMQLNVRNGSVLQTLGQFDKKSFDLVTLFHVLEHLVEPLPSLRAIGEHLKDTGLLYIEVPNATRLGSPTYMFFKAHVLYFDHGSLRNTLMSAGFDVLFQNAPDAGNLRILARYDGSDAGPTKRPHQHELVSAQAQRKWVPYLWQQLLAGEPVHKLIKRSEEKATARQYTRAQDLLQDIYSF